MIKLYEIPEPSTAICSEIVSIFLGSNFKILFDYDKNGEIVHSGIVFRKVRAHKHIQESHCQLWQIQSAYDTLVEIDNSNWINELRKETSEHNK
jgi:hypothetical protein